MTSHTIDLTSDPEDSDDDIFNQGGRQKPLSIYCLPQLDGDDSDDDIEVEFLPRKRPRGRPPKAKGPEVTPELKKRKKKAKKSVFDESSSDDGEVQEVTPIPERDEVYIGLSSSLANARAELEKGRPDNIEREAALEARAEHERMQREERNRQDQPVNAEAVRQTKAAGQRERSDQDGLQARGRPICLNVRMEGKKKIAMRIRTTDRLLKMLPPFCEKNGVNIRHVVMKVDGEEVGEKDTPESMDCDEGMLIDVEMCSSVR